MVRRIFWKQGICSVLFVLFPFLCFYAVCAHAQAETQKSEEEILKEIKTHGNSVVRVESVCWDGDQTIYGKKSFSGFVVSGSESEIYVATVYEHIAFLEEEKDAIRKEHGLEENDRISEKVEVIFQGDLRVGAEMVGESEQRNLTIFQLEQKINIGEPLVFSESDVSKGEAVYLLSFPGTGAQGIQIYNMDNVQTQLGMAQSLYRKDDVIFFRHNIQATTESVGGLILDGEGQAVGMLLTSSTQDKAGAALSASALKSFLETLGIGFSEHEETEAEKKFPTLQVLLGVVILVLLYFVVRNYIQERSQKESGTDEHLSAPKRKRGEGKAKKAGGASVEYPSEKRTAKIEKRVFVIGRSQGADFVLENKSGISRRHACIRTDGKRFYLTDLHSTNHTFLNGTQVSAGENLVLSEGDTIQVGRETLIFHVLK